MLSDTAIRNAKPKERPYKLVDQEPDDSTIALLAARKALKARQRSSLE